MRRGIFLLMISLVVVFNWCPSFLNNGKVFTSTFSLVLGTYRDPYLF